MSPFSARVRRKELGFLLFVLATVHCGCSRGTQPAGPQGTLRGTVSYQGELLTKGRVVLYMGQTGIGVEAKIESDGEFVVDRKLPVGTYVVTILPPTEKGSVIQREVDKKDTKDTGTKDGDWKLPKKFGQEKSSGLRIEVVAGENVEDLELPN